MKKETWLLSLDKASKKDLMGKRKMKVPVDRIFFKFLWSAVLLSLVAVIVWQGAKVVSAKIEYERGNEFYKNLASKLSLANGQEGLSDALYGEKNATSLPDYEAMKNGAVIENNTALTYEEKRELALYNARLSVLKSQNPDTMGWIYIPGTNIDYPIMMPPDDDSEFYMDHDFSGAEYSQGSIFVESVCSDAILENKNTIIVGHNIRLQGMMFNQLAKFGEKEFFDSHSEIYIYTSEGKFVFKLFSFYRANYQYRFRRVHFTDDADFLQYITQMQQNSWFTRPGVALGTSDRIITLYTCTNDNVKTNRYVAVAVLQECLLNP